MEIRRNQQIITKETKKMDLRLRPYKPCDANSIVSWIKDEAALRDWSSDRFGDFPVTSEDINSKFGDRWRIVEMEVKR